MQLFVDRAASASPGFTLDKRTVTPVIEICRRLDGMPLALELAAARLRVLSAEQIAQRLDDRFKLLTGGSRGALARQRTLRAAIDWSYETLSDVEQCLFARLCVFAGPFGIERAEAISSGEPIDAGDVLDLLDSLVAKSLVVRSDHGGSARYRLLETLRAYGWERMRERGELEVMRSRHADVLCRAVEEATPLLSGPQQSECLDRLEEESGDHRAALEWLLESGDHQQALQLAAALWRFWDHRRDTSEGRMWMRRVLAAAPEPTPMRLAALVGGTYLGMLDDDLPSATAWCEEGMALARALGDERSRGRLLVRLAEIVRHQTDSGRAVALAQEALGVLLEADDAWGIAQARWRLTLLAWDRGDLDRATALAGECLSAWDEQGDLAHAAGARALLAGIARDRGDLARATELYTQSLSEFRAAREPHGAAQMVLLLASIAVDLGDADRAQTLGTESLDLHEELGDTRGIARSLLVLAGAAFFAGDFDRADALARAASSRMEERSFSGDLPLAATLLARIALERGEVDQAEQWCADALGPYHAGGVRRHAAPALVVQARTRIRAGDPAAAVDLAVEARELFDTAGDPRGVAVSLEVMAEASVAAGDVERAARFLSAARSTRQTVGADLAGPDLAAHERTVEAVRASLDGTEFGRVWTEEWDEVVIDLTTRGARRADR